MESTINKELLQRYFDGKTTIFEKKMIDDWATKLDNQEIFYQMLSKHEIQNPQLNADFILAYQKHNLRMKSDEFKMVELPANNSTKYNYSKWVAAAIFIFSVGFGGYINRSKIIDQTFHTGFGEVKSIVLNDGSKVVLNANTTLKIPRFGFGKRSREVFLEGEAQFSIQHTSDNQPFIVKTSKNFDVLVLGTEFNVYTRLGGAKVVLNKGKIQLRYSEGSIKNQLMMKPGDLITFDKLNKIKKTVPSEVKQFSAWKEHRFIFNETSLEEIIQLFEDNFGTRVIINDKDLLSWTVSGSFTALNADELLETLTIASNLNFKKEGNSVIIFKEK
jgi:transmembrane sensor